MSKLFLATLFEGSRAFTMKRGEGSIVMKPVEGMEAEFSRVVTSVMQRSEFACFPTSDGSTGYSRLEIHLLEDADLNGAAFQAVPLSK